MDNYEDLVEAAEKATPGPWYSDEARVYIKTAPNQYGRDTWAVARVYLAVDTNFAALANPSRILALVKELREARRPVAPTDQELLALLREVRPILERVFQGKRNKDLRARIVAAIDSSKDHK